ncbi:hypothetical protein KC327_g51 [Hortaea werneckii]|nr:hypothetical protein KC327_g51 [Hortaea werneckii]
MARLGEEVKPSQALNLIQPLSDEVLVAALPWRVDDHCCLQRWELRRIHGREQGVRVCRDEASRVLGKVVEFGILSGRGDGLLRNVDADALFEHLRKSDGKETRAGKAPAGLSKRKSSMYSVEVALGSVIQVLR